ncbi:SKP1/BTB/POZ domain-containing protein [Orpheovirus IHUMI-LCC2]|uniref:SKP1/BTB/POZ domain-containing protein n=1 Tax=Orpheovirus IHUMI-LCC2 TaxID=2023057 RepID=A0A2I2L4Q0_9VIRU|nr:SKP1/BTB/POZ domain-containing protein [Orpheovirus IHUMI-LCC2]SNW62491.1 SKP1/BTB/POZ domain-containing protein [Orpheovirus IHUMI-LCC2]
MELDYLFNNELFSDIIIEGNDNTWYAHKVILSHHSEMLKKRFTLGTTDKEEKTIRVTWSYDAIDLSIRFMYGRHFDSMLKDVYKTMDDETGAHLLLELYKISDYWCIPKLSEYICNYIYENLDENNINIFLSVESIYVNIQKKLIDYLSKKFMSDIITEDHMKNISKNLMNKMVRNIIYKSEYEYYVKLKRWCKLIGMDEEQKMTFLATYINFRKFTVDQLLSINAKDYMDLKDSLSGKDKNCIYHGKGLAGTIPGFHHRLCGKRNEYGNSCLNIINENELYCPNCS